MYNYNQIKSIHLEITSRCQASCPMCIRNIQGGVDNPWLELDEITLSQFKEWFPVDFIQQLDKLYMCGNTGDPIIAKDTLEIFKYLREVNPSIELSMNTNGSARDTVWWKELAEVNVRVIFGIDGLEDTHSLYRVGTDWHKIIRNAWLFIHAGGSAEWHMLVFAHNEHQIDRCREISANMGFKHFSVKHTARFKDESHTVLTPSGTTSHILQPSTRSKEFNNKFAKYNIEENTEIHCKVQADRSIYINAQGDVAACCWLDFKAAPPWLPALVNYKDRGFTALNLKELSLAEIFNNGYFNALEKSWKQPLMQCSKQCGKIDRFKEQFNDA